MKHLKDLTPHDLTGLKPGAKPYEASYLDGLIVRVQPSGVRTYYAQVARGKRVRIGPVGPVTITAAKARAKALRVGAAEQGVAAVMPIKATTLGKFLEEVYGPYVQTEHRRGQRTVDDIERAFEDLLPLPMDRIGVGHLDDHVSRRRKDKVKAATIRRGLNQLQGLMRYAVERKRLKASPFDLWKAPTAPVGNVVRYLSADEEQALLKALEVRESRLIRERESANKWRRARRYEQLPEVRDHVAPMVALLMATGCRYGEIASLTWAAVDLEAGALTVEGARAKSGRGRVVPLNASAIATFKRWREMTGAKSGLVFPGPDGEPIASIKTAWQTVKKLAANEVPSIANLRVHDLRHHVASALVQRGARLEVVQQLLGHSTLALTQRYAHMAPTATRDAVLMLDKPVRAKR